VPNRNRCQPCGHKKSWFSKTFFGTRVPGVLMFVVCSSCSSLMRKLIANSVLLLLLAVFFAPAFANTTSTSLPACCRRGGAHHCTTVALIPGGISFRAAHSCPMWHAPLLVSSIAALPSSQLFAFHVRRERVESRLGTSSYSSSAHSESQRGPPELLL